jgi:hypothetical protein
MAKNRRPPVAKVPLSDHLQPKITSFFTNKPTTNIQTQHVMPPTPKINRNSAIQVPYVQAAISTGTTVRLPKQNALSKNKPQVTPKRQPQLCITQFLPDTDYACPTTDIYLPPRAHSRYALEGARMHKPLHTKTTHAYLLVGILTSQRIRGRVPPRFNTVLEREILQYLKETYCSTERERHYSKERDVLQ